METPLLQVNFEPKETNSMSDAGKLEWSFAFKVDSRVTDVKSDWVKNYFVDEEDFVQDQLSNKFKNQAALEGSAYGFLREYSEKVKEQLALSKKTMQANLATVSQELDAQQRDLNNMNTQLHGTVEFISAEVQTMSSRVRIIQDDYTQRFQQLNDCFDTIVQTLSSYQTPEYR